MLDRLHRRLAALEQRHDDDLLTLLREADVPATPANLAAAREIRALSDDELLALLNRTAPEATP